MSREAELTASEQMRDRIALLLEDEASRRDTRSAKERAAGTLPKSSKARLLWSLAQMIKTLPGRLSQRINPDAATGCADDQIFADVPIQTVRAAAEGLANG